MLQNLLSHRDEILQTGSRADTLKPWFIGSSVIHVVQVEPVMNERQQYEAIVVTGAYATERYREGSSQSFGLLSISQQLCFSFLFLDIGGK